MEDKKTHRIPENQTAKAGDAATEFVAYPKAELTPGQLAGLGPLEVLPTADPPPHEEWVVETPFGAYLVQVSEGTPHHLREVVARAYVALKLRQGVEFSGLTKPKETAQALKPFPPLPEELPKPGWDGPGDYRGFLLNVDALIEENAEEFKAISPWALWVYEILLADGLRRLITLRPDFSKAVNQVVTFIPVEVLAMAAGIPERSVYVLLHELSKANLIAWRAWKTWAVVRGRPGIYNAGTLFAVKVPGRPGRPRLYPEDFTHQWRDLTQDIEDDHTAWAEKQAWRAKGGPSRRRPSQPPWVTSAESSRVDHLERAVAIVMDFSSRGALTPIGFNLWLALDSAKAAAERLFARLLRNKRRAALVEETARGVAEALRDPGGFRFYARAIWSAFRGQLYGYAPNALQVFFWAVRQGLGAKAAGSVRNPAALVVHLLKRQGFLDLFQRYPGLQA